MKDFLVKTLIFTMLVAGAASCCTLCSGCATKQTYVEGTSVQLGAYIPMDGSLYGLNIVSYLNGCQVKIPTNATLKVSRSTSICNNWLYGLMQSAETNKTEILVGK